MSARRGEKTRPRFTPWLLPSAGSVLLLLLGYWGDRIPVGFNVFVDLRANFLTKAPTLDYTSSCTQCTEHGLFVIHGNAGTLSLVNVAS